MRSSVRVSAPRAVLVVATALGLAFGLARPGGAAVEDPVSVPPALPGAAAEGRYLDSDFDVSRTRVDVPYGEAMNSRGERQTLLLDVYEPDGDGEQFRPAVVWVHGGYFLRGSKTDVQFLHHLTRRGYVTVPITYRVRPEMPEGLGGIVLSPDVAENAPYFIDAVRDAQHDTMAAIRWVRANAADLRVDPGRIVVAGHSAGGLTTFNVVFNSEDPGDSGNPGWSSLVAAGLSSAGAYGPGISGRAALPGDAPMLVMHGTHDTVVPVVGSTLPCANKLAVGTVCEQRLYPGAGHGLPVDDRGITSAQFLYRHVIGAPRTGSHFETVTAVPQGGRAVVMGRLRDADGAAVGGARVLARATAGWAEATTGPDGSFTLTVDAPDHGRTASVLLRYEGHFEGTGLLARNRAPAHTTVTATWGG